MATSAKPAVAAKAGTSTQAARPDRPKSTNRPKSGAPAEDALGLLQAEHRSIGKLIDSYGRTKDAGRKAELAGQICTAVAGHARLKDEIFYPACAGKVDAAVLRQSQVRQHSAMHLIGDLRAGAGDDDFSEAKVAVLGEMMKQQAGDDERRLFAAARGAGLDLQQLADRLRRRKAELSRSGLSPDNEPAAAGARNTGPTMYRKETDMPQQDNRWRHEQLPHREDDEDSRRYGRQSDRWRQGDDDEQRRYGRQAGHGGGYGEVHDEQPGYGSRRVDYGRASQDRGRDTGDREGARGPSGERYGRQRPEDQEDDRRYRASGGYGDAEHPRRWDREEERSGPQSSGRGMSDEEWERRQGRRHQDDDRGGYGTSGGGGRGHQENEYQRRYGGGRNAYDEDRNRHGRDAGGYELSRGYRREDDGSEDDHRRYGGPREQWPDDQRRPQRLDQGHDEDDHRRYAAGGRSRYDVEGDERRERDQRARTGQREDERRASGGRDSDRHDDQRPLGSYGRSRY